MPRTAEPIKNANVLDEKIADRIAAMQAKNQAQSKILVGGHPPGLTLQVTKGGTASWLLRATINGKRREIGLGVYRRAGAGSRETAPVSLSEARAIGSRLFDAIRTGIDPVAALQAGRSDKSTFKSTATAYIAKERSEWRNAKHADQWASTFNKWVYPKIGDKPVEAINLADVERVLLQPVDAADGAPLWTARHVTARRVRQRIEAVLDYAAAKGDRDDQNSARLSGPLAKLLPGGAKKKVRKVRPHPALPHTDAPAFMVKLRDRKGTAAQALQFTIYTAARSGEVRHATWGEIDLANALWTRPGQKMKNGEAHTVPLSEPAVAILQAIPESRRDKDDYIFPSAKRDEKTGRFKALSDMTLAAVLKRMGYTNITVHGFRSTFRTWADSNTNYNRNVKESAIAHAIGESDTERAYLRDDYLEQRKLLMQDWANFLAR